MKNKFFKYCFLMFTVMLLVSCKIGNNYERPDFNLPEKYYLGDNMDTLMISETEDSLRTAKLKWRDFFKDKVLLSLVDEAIQNNLDLKKAEKNLEIQQELFKEAKVNNLPSLQLNLGYIREYFSDNYYSNPSSNYYGDSRPPSSLYTQKQQHNLHLRSSWEIDIWGKLAKRREASEGLYLESVAYKKLLQTHIVSEIAASYYNLNMLKAQLKIAQSNLELNENTLKILRLQYDAGEVSSLAVQQVESQKLRAETLIPQLERAYNLEENYLNAIMGRFPQHIELEYVLDNLESETLYSSGVPIELIQNRPDVAAAEYSLITANAMVGVQEAMRYPSLVIGGTIGLDAMLLNNFFDPVGSGLAFINGVITQPIFQQRRLKTNFEIAKKQREIAIMDFKETLINAVGEVSHNIVVIEKLQTELKLSEERLQIALKSVHNASLLFNSGLANYLEVLTAQSNALDVELSLAETKMELLIANVNLYRSLGGGWQ